MSNVSFCVADVQEDTVAGAPFDVVMSQFGRDVLRRARDGIRQHPLAPRWEDRIVFSCWQPIEEPVVPRRRTRGLGAATLDTRAGQEPDWTLALGDPGTDAGNPESAGFTNVREPRTSSSPEVPQVSARRRSPAQHDGRARGQDGRGARPRSPGTARFESGPGDGEASARAPDLPSYRLNISVRCRATTPCNTFVSAAPGSRSPASASAP